MECLYYLQNTKMVLGLQKETADDILAVFVAILMFQSIPRFPIIGNFFDQYPIVIFAIALILLVKRKDIIKQITN